MPFVCKPKGSDKSKDQIPITSRESDKIAQRACVTQQSKKRWSIVSGSEQNKQVLSDTSLLLAKLSLVSSLFLESNRRKIYTLRGTVGF